MTIRTESVSTSSVSTRSDSQEPFRKERETRRSVSPFYAIAGIAVVALAILGFLVATR